MAMVMAQYDDNMYAALEADDDSPLSDNIKASAAQFASLCDNELFPVAYNLPESILHRTFPSLTQQLPAYNPDHTVDTFSHDYNSIDTTLSSSQYSNEFASAIFPGIGQGNTTSPPLFAYMCREMTV